MAKRTKNDLQNITHKTKDQEQYFTYIGGENHQTAASH
jgi:hypothetical protein